MIIIIISTKFPLPHHDNNAWITANNGPIYMVFILNQGNKNHGTGKVFFKDNYDKMMAVSFPKSRIFNTILKSKYLKSHSLRKFPYLASPLQ